MDKLKNEEYFNEIHFLRAFACIGVLLVHVSATYYTQAGGSFNWFTYFFNQIGRFGTPTFAVISAFLLFNQVNKKGFILKKFIVSRTSKIVLPFIIWSIFYQLLTIYSLNGSISSDPKEFIYSFTTGQSFYHLYFMAIVVQFYLLFPFLQIIKSKLGWWISLISSALISMYFLKIQNLPIVSGIFEKFMLDGVFLLNWIFFFIFGGFLAYFWTPIYTWTKKNSILLLIMVIAVYIGAIIEYKIIGYVSSARYTNMINIPILSFATIGLYNFIVKINWIKISLQTIGKLSMGIYLIHPFTLIVLQKILPDMIWQTKFMPIIFFLVLGSTIFLVKIIQHLPKNQYIIPVPTKRAMLNKQNRQKKPVSA